MVVAAELVRVTAVSGRRRIDLAVPGVVPVAELVPELARAVGLLDPAATYAGYRVALGSGEPLELDRTLAEQGVEDGALLTVTAGADEPPPRMYDDAAEAVADVVRLGVRPWRPADARRTTTLVAAVLLALAAVLVAARGGPGVVAALPLRAPGRDPTAMLSVALVVVVLAGNALPVLALTANGARRDQLHIDPAAVAARVRRAHRLLIAMSAGVGSLTVLLVPAAVSRGTAGLLLAADACLVLLLRARQHWAFGQVLVDGCAGLAGLVAMVVALAVRRPEAGLTLAAVLAAAGGLVLALRLVPPPRPALRGRIGDVLETVALVGLLPLLLLATAGLARIGG